MTQYIDKDALVAKIERLYNRAERRVILEKEGLKAEDTRKYEDGLADAYDIILSLIDTLEVKDPYEQYVQYDSIKAGIQAHAEIYSFDIESELFNQLTEEQQKLWRKEIEQACISGGKAGVELARDIRYKENLDMKEVDLEKEISEYFVSHPDEFFSDKYKLIAKHFFELGMQQSNNDNNNEEKK